MARNKSRAGRYRQVPGTYPRGAPTSGSVRVRRARGEVEESRLPKTSTTLTSDELREEYWYVYNDLKRIAVVAGTLFAILIVLSFFI